MDRALWLVVGKVSAMMLLAGAVSLSRSEAWAVAVVLLGLGTYAVAMRNLLGGDETPRAKLPHEVDGGFDGPVGRDRALGVSDPGKRP